MATPAGSPPARPLIVVMGVSGSGKSTVGAMLADALGATFTDGDSLHPAANVAKMAAGIPLDDADRLPWLDAVGDTLAVAGSAGAVVACSALKRSYRERILAKAPTARFVELDGSRSLLAGRMSARGDHFMPTSLLDSQLATLEPLEADEPGMRVSIADGPDEIVAQVLRNPRFGASGRLTH